MEVNAQNTKTLLVLTAGQLFAELGFDGVSTRMIAEKAGVNLGGIHYHFGSKEALYVEAFRYVCEKEQDLTGIARVFDELPELEHSAEGIAKAIYISCGQVINAFFNPDKPEWQVRLMLRELSSPSSALPILANEVLKPSFEKNLEIFRRIKPDASNDEAQIWNDMAVSHVIFYCMAKKPMEIIRNHKEFDCAFLDTLQKMVAKAMIMLAGLPLPDELS